MTRHEGLRFVRPVARTVAALALLAACSDAKKAPELPPQPSMPVATATTEQTRGPTCEDSRGTDSVTVKHPVTPVIELIVEHTVQPEETVSELAACHFADADQGDASIRASNHLSKTAGIITGQVLEFYITQPDDMGTAIPLADIDKVLVMDEGYSSHTAQTLSDAGEFDVTRTKKYIKRPRQEPCAIGEYYYVIRPGDVSHKDKDGKNDAPAFIRKTVGNPTELGDTNQGMDLSHPHAGEIIRSPLPTLTKAVYDTGTTENLFKCD